jgi:cytochrome c
MDSFEWNKIIGAVLGSVLFILVIKVVAEAVYEPEKPAKPGYVVEGVAETPAAGTTAAPTEEPEPDFGTVLAKADLAAGKAISGRCEQCHDIAKGGPNKIGPELWGVIGRPRASEPGFSYSSAMMSDHAPWTFALLFKYLKSPATMVPGTKMSFAGLPHAQDRIDLIAYLRTQSDSPVAIPPPAPAVPAAADAPAATGSAAPATTAPAAAPAAGAPDTAKPAQGAPQTAPATPPKNSPNGN